MKPQTAWADMNVCLFSYKISENSSSIIRAYDL